GAVVSQSRNVFPNEIQFSFGPEVGGNAFDFNSPSRYRALSPNMTSPFFIAPDIFLLAQTPCNQFGTCNQFGPELKYFTALMGRVFANNNELAFTLPEKKLRTPYAQQWHLTVEREVLRGYLLSIAYVGSKGTKLTRLTTPNLGKDITTGMDLVLTVSP